MTKTITESEISTLKYMFQTFPESTRKTLIENQCSKYKITAAFVREFKEYITKDSFSKSPELSYDVISAFPDLYDYKVWMENTEKSLEPLMHDGFVDAYVPSKDVNPVMLGTNAKNINLEVFEKHFKILNDDVKTYVVNNSKITSEELVRKHPDLVDITIFSNRNVPIKWTNPLIEYVLQNKRLTVGFLIAILSQTNDFGFMKRMLETDFDYVKSGETFDNELKNFLMNVPYGYYPLVFDRVLANSPNALTYDVLKRILDVNDSLTEEFLIENLDVFKRSGLVGRLAEYARANEYKGLMVALKLSS
jgi:hypothetical protein